MDEALSSILCAEERWIFRGLCESIGFNADGTGNLWCSCADFNCYIALALSWRLLPPAPPVARNASARRPQLLGQLNVEITLERKLAPGAPEQHGKYLIEGVLCDAAFTPKSFCIRIEKGDFIEPGAIRLEGFSLDRYSLRLLFDKSPYPPREEWKEPQCGPDSLLFWEHAEFVARRQPGLKGKGMAMNDRAWSSCVAC
ncbi:MAG: hypothetical protein M1829_002660 [Trizodia sp. TS-e1964]|nr:MAG: hypothetical protein M1829_002660 [Trizodia sp. TS-e1964]